MTVLPEWLIKRTPKALNIRSIRAVIADSSVFTVCESALCPNIGECYSKKTVTFMILGDICTRNCRFCAVSKGQVSAPDPDEPNKVAEAAKKLGLSHVVITSVTRDDLEDKGASQFKKTILAVKKALPQAKVEVLIPDLGGDIDFLNIIIDTEPNILNHNLETVPRL